MPAVYEHARGFFLPVSAGDNFFVREVGDDRVKPRSGEHPEGHLTALHTAQIFNVDVSEVFPIHLRSGETQV